MVGLSGKKGSTERK